MGDAGIGMPAQLKLQQFGRELRHFFDAVPYLVGSVLKTTDWRDVDVRVILDDEQFDAMFDELTSPRCLNLKWNACCLAFASLGRDMTGLPIDFQVDRQTEANEQFDGPRSGILDPMLFLSGGPQGDRP